MAYDAKKLLKKFETIIDEENFDKVEKSNEIMKSLREECIYVKNSYINKFKKGECKVTINPFAHEVKQELDAEEEEGIYDDQYTRIYAYSFGAFRPRIFFDGNLQTFVWIIWEPYLCDMVQMRGRAEGYAQDTHYSHWGEVKKNSTHRNIVIRTRLMLEKIGVIYQGSEDEIMDHVLNHICILEVNHFPGLALAYNEEDDTYYTKSDDRLIKEWSDLNKYLIRLFINFYDADIIIGGGVLKYFHTVESYDKSIIKSIHDEDGKVLSKLGFTPDKECLKQNLDFIDGSNNYIIPTIGGPIFIQANHPSNQYGCYPESHAIYDGERIAKWLNRLNDNVMSESPNA